MVAITELLQTIRKYSEGGLRGRVFDPMAGRDDPVGMLFAATALRDAIDPPPPNLLPLMPVCDSSFACAVCDRDIFDEALNNGEIVIFEEALANGEAFEVVRWHLGRVDERKQAELLDVDAIAFLDSINEELSHRDTERNSVLKSADSYYDEYVVDGRRPKVDTLRPVQLACQNVIIGLASLRHDPVFDGLRVEAYATCEVAHLATGEADRAMAALILCDAFQSGGTMEVRFGPPGRRERHIPPALVRYARVRGLTLGAQDPCSISPSEARDLFLLVTPMPEQLRYRAFEAFNTGQITPERLCYSLMAGIWSHIELAYILATTPRAPRILEGGSYPEFRLARSAETEICRSALMTGMLLRRLDNATEPNTASSAVELNEDWRLDTSWAIKSDLAAIAFSAVLGRPMPWCPVESLSDLPRDSEAIIVLPRGTPLPSDADLLRQIKASQPQAAAFLLVPADADMATFDDVPHLLCPQTLDELDQTIRRKLDTLRIVRR